VERECVVPDQPSTGNSPEAGKQPEDALKDAQSNLQAAQDHLRGVSDMIHDTLAADDLLAGGQSADDAPGQAKR
jgi:hypothetical protein